MIHALAPILALSLAAAPAVARPMAEPRPVAITRAPSFAAADRRPDPFTRAPARAAEAGSLITLAPLPAEVRAGEVVTLRWSEPVPGIEEFEILLSVDDGRSFPLRVTPELDARAGEYRWRVPDLPTATARLRVRAGNQRGEFECAPGAPFRITGRDAAARPEVAVHESGWWDGLTAARGAVSAALGPARATLHAAAEPAYATVEDRAPRGGWPAAHGTLMSRLTRAAGPLAAPDGERLIRSPLRVPMRR